MTPSPLLFLWGKSIYILHELEDRYDTNATTCKWNYTLSEIKEGNDKWQDKFLFLYFCRLIFSVWAVIIHHVIAY